MQNYPGTFLVLEGVDGSGKGTQFRLLAERLRAVGHDVEIFDFPRYDEPSSYFVKRYLNGDYGPAGQVSPYSASLFYALDRFEAGPQIRKALEAGKIVLSNRYVGSNMAHQGSKFASEAEQRGFFIWAESLEYQLLSIPRPTLNIFLRVPADIAHGLIAKKNKRNYTSKVRDEHEADIEHLQRSIQTYDTLCQLFPKDFVAINCTKNGQIQTIPAINDLIWQTIKPLLPQSPAGRAKSKVVKLNEANTAVQEPKKAPSNDRTEMVSLLGVTELLKIDNGLKVELMNLGSDSKVSFYKPPGFSSENLKKYQTSINNILSLRADVHSKLQSGNYSMNEVNCAVAQLAPMAAFTELMINPNAIANETLPLKELATLLKEVSEAKPSTDYLTKIAQEQLSDNVSTQLEPVNLLDSWPRNEFDVLADSLYAVSDLPRNQLNEEIQQWTYSKKSQALDQILKNSSAGSKLTRYRFDVIADQSTLISLLMNTSLDGLQTQAPTPRYGYDIPEIIEKAGLEEEYISCFDVSLELFSSLQMLNNGETAAYATLLGHKVRFQFTVSLGSLILMTKRPELKIFVAALLSKIGENHPIIADFLNTKTKKPDMNVNTKRSSGRHRRAK